MKHTPGPWLAEAGGGKGAWIKGSNDEWAALACGDSAETANANARLIAAAPDALAVCRGVEAWWNEHQYDVDRYDCGDGYVDEMNVYDDEPEFVTLAKAVIAKVETP